MKNIFYCAICLCSSVTLSAQDKIIKRTGVVIDTKISSVNTTDIAYKKFDNLSGPDYFILKSDVARIHYSNGSEDVFNADTLTLQRQPAQVQYVQVATPSVPAGPSTSYSPDSLMYKDIVSFSPIQASENGLGLSFSEEHYLDKYGWVSFYLPLIVTFNIANNHGVPKNDPIFYLMPGIKFYTNMNSYRTTKFSIGPSLVIAAGRKTEYSPNNYNNEVYYQKTRFMLGAIINGGLNFFPSPHLYIGSEVGLGVTYLNQLNGKNQGITGLFQLNFKIGYRF